TIYNASGIISLLTLAPSSWSQQTCADYFSVSISQVKRSHILKKEKGIPSVPDKKIGRKISLDEIEIVQDFYLSDDYSRIMPGMKDNVSVRQTEGDKKVKIQKRLLLINIDELFFKSKEYCLNQLCMKGCGKSKFFELRPKHVIEVGAAGIYNVCVWEKH
ncbi:Cc8L18.2-like protein, partial [Daphnia magna]